MANDFILSRFGIVVIFSLLSFSVSSEESGKDLYLKNCAVCHQAKGEGIDGFFPNLVNNAYVLADPQALVMTVLDGRGGMPSFRNGLNDEVLSKVLTYVRKTFGNNSPTIEEAFIKKVRDQSSEKLESDHDV